MKKFLAYVVLRELLKPGNAQVKQNSLKEIIKILSSLWFFFGIAKSSINFLANKRNRKTKLCKCYSIMYYKSLSQETKMKQNKYTTGNRNDK